MLVSGLVIGDSYVRRETANVKITLHLTYHVSRITSHVSRLTFHEFTQGSAHDNFVKRLTLFQNRNRHIGL